MLKYNLQFFSEPDTNDQKPEQAAEPTTPDSDPDKKAEAKTIPYERFKQVNDKAKEFEQSFSDLGIESIESLKELVESHEKFKSAEKERKDAELSEKDRAEKLADQYKKEREDLEQQLASFRKQSEQDKITYAFKEKAQTAGISYVDDARALADLSAVKVTDNGVEGIDEVITALVEHKPFLLGQKKEQRSVGGPSNPSGGSSQKSAEQLLEEAAEKVKKSGRTEDMAAYSKLRRELGV